MSTCASGHNESKAERREVLLSMAVVGATLAAQPFMSVDSACAEAATGWYSPSRFLIKEYNVHSPFTGSRSASCRRCLLRLPPRPSERVPVPLPNRNPWHCEASSLVHSEPPLLAPSPSILNSHSISFRVETRRPERYSSAAPLAREPQSCARNRSWQPVSHSGS